MTGYKSKRAAARDKLEDDDTQVYKDHGDALTIAYQSGYYDGKKAAQPAQEPWRESASDYERGVIDGRQMQAQSSVDKAVNRMAQRPWVGLMRGARVEGDTVVIKVQSNNEARLLCSELVDEMEKNNAA